MAAQPKSRPITDAEFARLTDAQRAALGLDYTETAPADFGGAVFPNPEHVRPFSDTDPLPATRLPNGVRFLNDLGTNAKFDISNPPAAQLIAPAMQTIAAKSEGQPVSTRGITLPAQTVPVFSPDGTLGDIPQERLQDAIKAGYKPGVTMKTADGKTGIVPADRVQEAAKDGLQMVPLAEQETQHAGFWHTAAGIISGLAKAAPAMFETPGINPGTGELTTGAAGRSQENVGAIAQADAERKALGESHPYRLAAAAASLATPTNVPAMEQAAREGDIGAVAAHAVVPAAVTAAPLVGEGVGRLAAPAVSAAADATTRAVKSNISAVAKTSTAIGDSLDPDLVGLISPRAAHALRLARKVGTVATKVDEKINPAPSAEAAAPTPAAAAPATTPAAQPAPAAAPQAAATKPTLTAAGFQEAQALGRVPTAADSAPHTLSGESALRKVLTGQDNANLLKIAKSRGINVTKEAQLKPGSADNMLIDKIVDDFKPEELDEIGARYLESSRFKHDFGDIGPEAWKTMSLQTYFPELKIPQATVARTHAAILKAAAKRVEAAAPKEAPAAPTQDLTGVLQESVKRAKATKLTPKLSDLQ